MCCQSCVTVQLELTWVLFFVQSPVLVPYMVMNKIIQKLSHFSPVDCRPQTSSPLNYCFACSVVIRVLEQKNYLAIGYATKKGTYVQLTRFSFSRSRGKNSIDCNSVAGLTLFVDKKMSDQNQRAL